MRYVTVDEAKRRIEADGRVVVLDARASERYGQGRVPGAINLPADAPDLARRARDLVLDTQATILVYAENSRSPESRQVARTMDAMGYRDVLLFDGGFSQWAGAGHPVEPSETPEEPDAARL
ncbi:MAG TPA: rhodanese-like domain-containing protein [Candidatus Thermoplasmatota archaeon]|nr:rhodanese-like domain-containing protein [Candidatus Thermoplasmatota archaeon]